MNNDLDLKKQNSNSENDRNRNQSSPDEVSGFYFEGHIKIFDPESNEIIENKRT